MGPMRGCVERLHKLSVSLLNLGKVSSPFKECIADTPLDLELRFESDLPTACLSRYAELECRDQ